MRLLREAPDEPPPVQARPASGARCNDPTLRLLLWRDELGGYVDVHGNPVELCPDESPGDDA